MASVRVSIERSSTSRCFLSLSRRRRSCHGAPFARSACAGGYFLRPRRFHEGEDGMGGRKRPGSGKCRLFPSMADEAHDDPDDPDPFLMVEPVEVDSTNPIQDDDTDATPINVEAKGGTGDGELTIGSRVLLNPQSRGQARARCSIESRNAGRQKAAAVSVDLVIEGIPDYLTIAWPELLRVPDQPLL
ncbi:hypothetical protein GUJ93_ZPchr0010g9262 [Zizania palustris]|uniref:Uncharacterized protein n=1 Tax=Zizania palustris TaxID=103762 RepID=A0A8J5WFT2_ZIZPA|nr:hypothetical protein GUJ93_ZPchr0010g9262 [Zizania palustris]